MQVVLANRYPQHFHQLLLFNHTDLSSYKNSRSLKGNASHTNTHCMPDNTQHVHKSRTAVVRHIVSSSVLSFSNMELRTLSTSASLDTPAGVFACSLTVFRRALSCLETRNSKCSSSSWRERQKEHRVSRTPSIPGLKFTKCKTKSESLQFSSQVGSHPLECVKMALLLLRDQTRSENNGSQPTPRGHVDKGSEWCPVFKDTGSAPTDPGVVSLRLQVGDLLLSLHE